MNAPTNNRIFRFFEKRRKEKPAQEQEPATKPKTFVIFLDYNNLELHLKKTAPEKLKDFSWLFGPILKEGKVVLAFVFIPRNKLDVTPVMQLTRLHHFVPILCPRQIDKNKGITKDADTVDTKMAELAKQLIQYSDITDIVIVSGDADFAELANFAYWQQKSVWVISAINAISGRLMEMHKSGSVKKVSLVE